MSVLRAQIIATLTNGHLGYSVSHTADVVDCGRSLVYEALAAGNLKAKKLQGRTIIPVWELVVWLEELPDYQPAGPRKTTDTGSSDGDQHSIERGDPEVAGSSKPARFGGPVSKKP